MRKRDLPTGVLIVPANYSRRITVFDVQCAPPDVTFSRDQVLDLLQRQAEALNPPFDKRYPDLKKIIRDMMQGQWDIQGALDQVLLCFHELAAYLTGLKASGDFRSLLGWLRETRYYERLFGSMGRADNLIHQYTPDSDLHPALMHLRGLVLDVTGNVQAAEKLTVDRPVAIKAAANKLLQALGENALSNCDRLVGLIKESIDQGGRPEGTTSPIHEALWEVGKSIFYQHQDKPDWCSKTTTDIWKAVRRKPAAQRNPAENLIYQEWKSKMGKSLKNGFQECKDQVRYTFKNHDLGDNRL